MALERDAAEGRFAEGDRVRLKDDRLLSLLCELLGGRAGTVTEIGAYFVWVLLDGEDEPRPCWENELEVEDA